METPFRVRLLVLVVVWLAVAGGISAQVGGAWNGGNKPARRKHVKEYVMSRWDKMSAIQIDFQLFIEFEDGRRMHLYTDKKPRCFLRATFLNSSRIFVGGCKRTLVADLNGTVQYKLRRFRFFDIASNQDGTRFAVFERGRSAWHDLGDSSYDKLRLLVYSTKDGKKLYQRKWSQAPQEEVIDAGISFSDDGSILYLHQTETTAFSIPAGRSH